MSRKTPEGGSKGIISLPQNELRRRDRSGLTFKSAANRRLEAESFERRREAYQGNFYRMKEIVSSTIRDLFHQSFGIEDPPLTEPSTYEPVTTWRVVGSREFQQSFALPGFNIDLYLSDDTEGIIITTYSHGYKKALLERTTLEVFAQLLSFRTGLVVKLVLGRTLSKDTWPYHGNDAKFFVPEHGLSWLHAWAVVNNLRLKLVKLREDAEEKK